MRDENEELVERILRGTGVSRTAYERRAAERVVLSPAELRERQAATLRRQADALGIGSVERARLLARADELEQTG